jgi:hypothetical protein
MPLPLATRCSERGHPRQAILNFERYLCHLLSHFSKVLSELHIAVVPANAGTQLLLDSGVRRNDASTQSEIIFENRHRIDPGSIGRLFFVEPIHYD